MLHSTQREKDGRLAHIEGRNSSTPEGVLVDVSEVVSKQDSERTNDSLFRGYLKLLDGLAIFGCGGATIISQYKLTMILLEVSVATAIQCL
jgi:hypothetical protein